MSWADGELEAKALAGIRLEALRAVRVDHHAEGGCIFETAHRLARTCAHSHSRSPFMANGYDGPAADRGDALQAEPNNASVLVYRHVHALSHCARAVLSRLILDNQHLQHWLRCVCFTNTTSHHIAHHYYRISDFYLVCNQTSRLARAPSPCLRNKSTTRCPNYPSTPATPKTGTGP